VALWADIWNVKRDSTYNQVSTYADLPTPASNYTGEIYIVTTSTSLWIFNRKEAGQYYSNGSEWVRLGDWPEAFRDSNFEVYNNADETKKLKFELSSIPTATTRTLTPPPGHDGEIFTHPAQLVTAAISGGDFTDPVAANNSITDASPSKPYVIKVMSGVYTVNNPIVTKANVHFLGVGDVVLIPQNVNSNMFDIGTDSSIENFIIQGCTGGIAINKTTAGTSYLMRLIIIDCNIGIKVNSDCCVYITQLVIKTVAGSFTDAVKIEAGNCTLVHVTLFNLSTCIDFFDISGSNSIVTIEGFTTFSPNVTNAFYIHDNPRCVFRALSLVNMFRGYYIEGPANIRNIGASVFNAQSEAVYIPAGQTGIEIGVFTSEFTSENGTYDINILSGNTLIYGSGNVANSERLFLANPVTVTMSYVDLKQGDEALSVLGELHVGTPFQPAESCMGEGDSYTAGMFVFTYNATTTEYVNVTSIAASPTNSTFTLPNGAINTAIYFATALSTVEDFIKHFGLKIKVTKAGGVTSDITITGTAAAGGYNDNFTRFNNNKVYVRTDNAYYLFKTQNYWVIDTSPPTAGAKFTDGLYNSLSFEGTYNPIAPATGNPVLQINAFQVDNPFVLEYYNDNTDTWDELHYMMTDSDSPYFPYAERALMRTGSYQVRYDALLNNKPWGKTDPPGLSVPFFYTRLRLTSTITDLPIIEQVKIHSNRMEVNADGWPEWYGTARPTGTLDWKINELRPGGSSPGDQDLFLSDTLDRGMSENAFAPNATDRGTFAKPVPVETDTSTPLRIAIQYIVTGNTGGNIQFTISWSYSPPNDNLYTTSAAAPTTHINQQSIVVLDPAPAVANLTKWFTVDLDISKVISRRDGGFPDVLYVSVERAGNAVDDTNSDTVALSILDVKYAIWCQGSHI